MSLMKLDDYVEDLQVVKSVLGTSAVTHFIYNHGKWDIIGGILKRGTEIIKKASLKI